MPGRAGPRGFTHNRKQTDGKSGIGELYLESTAAADREKGARLCPARRRGGSGRCETRCEQAAAAVRAGGAAIATTVTEVCRGHLALPAISHPAPARLQPTSIEMKLPLTNRVSRISPITEGTAWQVVHAENDTDT